MADRRTGAARSARAAPAARRDRAPMLRVIDGRDERRSAKDRARLARVDLILLVVAAGFLTAVGLVMVLSAGSVSAAQGYGGNSFWYFQRQVAYAAIGIGVAYVISRVPTGRWRTFADAAPGGRRDPDGGRGAAVVRHVAVRCVAVDRPRTGHPATVGVREARAGGVRRHGAEPEGREAARPRARVAAARPRRGGGRAPRAAPARPRHDADPVRDRRPHAVRGRRAPATPHDRRRRRLARGGVPRLRRGLPADALASTRGSIRGPIPRSRATS